MINKSLTGTACRAPTTKPLQPILVFGYLFIVPNRHTIRLREFDYSQARAYFITICTDLKKPYFGKVVNDSVVFTEIGEIVRKCWEEIPPHYPHTEIKDYVIMPNHIHGIIRITEQTEETVEQFGKANRRSIPAIIRAFKSVTTRRKNERLNTAGGSLWQRNYWERIIRDDTELYNVQQYIQNNPKNWKTDTLLAPDFSTDKIK